MKEWIEDIEKLGACRKALEWAKDYPTLKEAWEKCERGDWMLWLVGKYLGSPRSERRKILVLATCECARLALPHATKGDTRPLQAIEMTERWASGEQVSIEDIMRVADAAYAAYAATNAAYAADAAYAAAHASYAAYAADAARAAAHASYATYTAALKQCAGIVRKYYPDAPGRGKNDS